LQVLGASVGFFMADETHGHAERFFQALSALGITSLAITSSRMERNGRLARGSNGRKGAFRGP
jgi:hypothetical protein